MASKIDLFSLATHDNELIESEYIKLTTELKRFPIEFRLKDNKEYVDLWETLLRLKVKVSNADGSAVPDQTNSVSSQVALFYIQCLVMLKSAWIQNKLKVEKQCMA